jgi:hypothetical protein
VFLRGRPPRGGSAVKWLALYFAVSVSFSALFVAVLWVGAWNRARLRRTNPGNRKIQ